MRNLNNRRVFRVSRMAIVVGAAFFLSGCEHFPLLGLGQENGPATSVAARADTMTRARADYSVEVSEGRRMPINLGARIPKNNVTNPSRALAVEAMWALQEGRLEDASQLFNTALRLDLSNSSLQFMNAFTYHLMAMNGDAQKFSLAEQGYSLAYKFDPTNVLSFYYKGLAYLDQRKFAEAKGMFAIAAVMDDADPEILYDLARAAYYSGDPRTANAALEKLGAMKQSAVDQGKLMRASIVTKAALGQVDTARGLLVSYSAGSGGADAAEYLSRRVGAWERVHDETAATLRTAPPDASRLTGGAGSDKAVSGYSDVSQPMQLAQAIPRSDGVPVIPGAAARSGAAGTGRGTAGASPDFVNSDMTVVDVVIVGTQEDVGDTKGMNLLSGLELQFGDPVTRTAGFSLGKTNIDDRTAANNDTVTRTFTRLISIPAVNYSLNIFNTLTGRNEILARPSLVALANERSEFFSGVDVIAAAVSGGDGAPVSINKQIGVKLSIVPEFLPGDRIKLKVEAERTFITTPSRSVVFNFRLDTSKTTVNANVVMKFGETLVLSGLTEKETESTRDAVPLLGDIPIIQYLFARQGSREYRKSVLIMLTPRRAQYANQDVADRQKMESSFSELEKSLARFEGRNKNWFVPKSTLAETMVSLENNSLFQEFKTGDFVLERWNRRDTHEKRLRTIGEFLFY